MLTAEAESRALEAALGDESVDRLRKALERDELQLFAQRIVALAEPGDAPLVEVLVRVREEEERLLPPGGFLSVFERCGMMPELDRWVVRQALARLTQNSRTPRLCINLSAHTLGEVQFLAYVAQQLSQYRIVPAALLFEISQNDALARPISVTQFVVAARRIGCGILLDSFGQSSVALTPLRSLRPDYLKIARSVVRNVDTDAAARRKLQTLVRVGKATGIPLIAECVETPGILQALKEAGIALGQGYGMHVPAPIEQVLV